MKFRFIGILFLFVFCIGFISCEREVSTSPVDPPVPTGFISIRSNPAGAEIYVNEKNTGRYTPDSLTWMPGGFYNLKLKLPYFKDSVFTVRIAEDFRDSVFIDFMANPGMYGKLYCNTDPYKALILINHKSTGKFTPNTLAGLSPGRYTVSFQAFGCREDSQTVNVFSSQTSSVVMTMKDTTIWLDYNRANSPLPSNFLTCVAVDEKDVKYIGTSDMGFASFDNYVWKAYNPSNSRMPGYSVNCMAVSEFGLPKEIWIGTNNGLVLFDPNSEYMNVYTTENSVLPDNYVTSVAIDRAGNKWVGTMNGLLYIAKGNINMKVYTKSNSGLPENWISQVGTDYNNRLWVGTANSGLVYYDLLSKWTPYTKANSSLPGSIVSALSVGLTLGGTWVGFTPTAPRGEDIGGMAVFDNNTWNTNFKDLPSKTIESIILHNNVRWVCTSSGIVKYLTLTSKELINTSNSRLPSNQIKFVAFDSNETVWIATATTGLVKYKTK